MTRHKRGPRQGVIMPLVAVALVSLLGAAALTIDIGLVLIAKQQLQRTADAAALAGVAILQVSLDPQSAVDVAVATAADNPVLGAPMTLDPAVDVVTGAYDAQTGELVPFQSSGGVMSVSGGVVAVRVTARRTVDSPDGPVVMRLARILGHEFAEVTAHATAGYATSDRPRQAVELVHP